MRAFRTYGSGSRILRVRALAGLIVLPQVRDAISEITLSTGNLLSVMNVETYL